VSSSAQSLLVCDTNLVFAQRVISSIRFRRAGFALPIQVDEEDIPFFAEVIAGGRITIPEEIRKIFGVKDGDHVMCRVRLVKRAEEVR
jgi:hypothetical protein